MKHSKNCSKHCQMKDIYGAGFYTCLTHHREEPCYTKQTFPTICCDVCCKSKQKYCMKYYQGYCSLECLKKTK